MSGVRCPVSGVWTRRQVSGGAPGVGVRGRGKGDPDRTAAGHVGGLGAVLGLQAGLHVTQGRVHARQEGSAGEGAGAAGWWRRGRVWAVLQFLDSCRTAPAPRVSPRLPRAPNRPATGTPRRCARATAPRTSTGTHVGRAVWTSVPDLSGRSGETVSARRHPRAWWVWSAHGQGLLRTQTMAPSQLGGDDLPAPGGHPCPLLPLEFLWASKGGVYGDAVRSHNLLVFSELFFPPQDHRKRQVWPLSFSKLSLFTF